MRTTRLAGVALLLLAFTIPVFAQEHYSEGPVWVISFYRTRQGQFDNYMKYLRSNYLVTSGEQKKQGLILDSKMYVKTLRDPNDWNVAIAWQYSSYGRALDFNAADDEKGRAIAAQHFKTTDTEQQQRVTAPRLEMRDFVGTEIVREVTLRPMKP